VYSYCREDRLWEITQINKSIAEKLQQRKKSKEKTNKISNGCMACQLHEETNRIVTAERGLYFSDTYEC